MHRFHSLMLGSLFLLLASQFCLAQTWAPQASNTIQDLNGLHMTSDSDGWVAGNGGVFLHTVDGGQTWTQVTLTNEDMQDVAFRDTQTGLLVGDNGTIFRTVNGGVSWSPSAAPTSEQLRGVDWGSGDVAWVTGREGVVLRSSNAGVTWSLVSPPTLERFRRVSANGTDLAWVVGDNGAVWHTTNAGVSWTQQTTPASGNVDDVQFLSATVGFASGSNDLVMQTGNGGQTWTLRNTGIAQGQNGLHFLDENTGWTAGGLGTIYMTTNAGLTWTPQASGTNQDLNDLFFTPSRMGWAVGNGGVLLHSDQGVAGIPCADITSMAARCIGGGVKTIQVRVNLLNSIIHAGETVTITIDGIPFTATIITNGTHSRANFSEPGWAVGDHVVSLVDPPGCLADVHPSCAASDGIAGTQPVWGDDAEWTGQGLPSETKLLGNYPNPFNPSTSIQYVLGEDTHVALKVYNMLGQEVATLVDDVQTPGYKTAIWNGRNDSGAPVASGLYIYTLKANNVVTSQRMLLMK